ncbi:crossover junction endodeoxyribonuclease RuvC [Pseudothermotoga thermarum]|uniref:Crossover junction endodeoxyribonuclease RuvC n=1 Tax=Pseudothermotoga thermarum DSM 5069 TaxID=688269 RepID=F7YV23_9THEM|nr:crossover junction endodeoxyribonuclease RuvC [Pseudothermotoga thermarum]AEH50307.1 Holliday junction endonuclease RuvC [Pseudothermotoga thermarum DSM 5069]
MIIFGVDPGFGILGYGVLKVEGNIVEHVAHGVIETEKDLQMSLRLKILYENLVKLFEKYKPKELAVEKLFFFRNVTTAISVGEARGVVLLLAAQKNIEVFEYTPHEVKKAITGSGKATKKDVQRMVKMFLNLKEIPKPDDAADALAIAWCHALARNIRRLGV